MVVGTHKLSHSRFDRPQAVFSEYLKSGFHEHFKTASHLPVMAKATADFIIADTAKGSFIAVEMKRNVRRASTRQISSYLRMLSAIPERPVENRLERLEKQFDELVKSTWSYLFSKRDVEEMGELSKGMLEDSKKMRELAQKLQDADDEE